MSTQHTPGPWRVYHAPLRPQFPTKIIEIQDNDGEPIVTWGGFDAAGQRPQRKLANARLMAAAPDMLAVLRETEAVLTIVAPRSHTKQYLGCLKRVRAALTRATRGRSVSAGEGQK